MSCHQKAAPVGVAIHELKQLLRRAEQPRRRWGKSGATTDCRGLDRLLGGPSLRRGSLIEWLGEGAGNGASMLALIVAREACQEGGTLMVIDRRGTFYPPAAQ